MTVLDLSAFEKAIKQLEKSLGFYDVAFAKKDEEMVEQLRSASIQAFEYTYEMSWKMLSRYLGETEPGMMVFEKLSFGALIRAGFDRGLLKSEFAIWKRYRDARCATSHTYDEDKAAAVFLVIPQFLQEAKYLLAKLQEGIKSL